MKAKSILTVKALIIATVILYFALRPKNPDLPGKNGPITTPEMGQGEGVLPLDSESENVLSSKERSRLASVQPESIEESNIESATGSVGTEADLLTGAAEGTVTGPEDEPVKDCQAIFLLREADSTALADFAERGRYRESEPFAITDASGVFLAQDLAPGTYIIAWRAPGYVYRAYDDPVDIKAGETTRGIHQQLERAGTIFGQVVENLTGKPVGGAKISASVATSLKHEGAILTVHKKVSFFADDKGEFRLDSLLPGEQYNLLAEHPDYADGKADNAPVDSGNPVRIVLSPGGSIEGRTLAESDREPISDARVLALFEGKIKKQVVSATEGQFLIKGLNPGSYSLLATCGNLRSEPVKDISVGLSGTVSGIEILLKPGLVIRGEVRSVDTGAPVPGATIQTSDKKFTAQSNASGFYRLEGLPAEKFSLTCTAQGFAKVETAVRTVEGQEQVCDFSLEPGGDLIVRVRDEKDAPIESAQVLLIEGMTPRMDMMQTTDSEGVANVKGVSLRNPPMIMAVMKGYGIAMPTKPEFPPESKVAEVKIVLKSTGPGGFFAGRVTDASDSPLSGAQVRWLSPMDQETAEVNTDAEGNYLIEVKGQGMMSQLQASAEGYAPKTKMNLTPGTEEEPARADFQLDPAHWLDVLAVDPDGKPVPNLVVMVLSSGFPPMPVAGHDQPNHTGEDGRCHFEGLPGPSVSLMVMGEGWSPIQNRTVDVDREVRLTVYPKGVLRGRVLNKKTEEPIKEFTVSMASSDMFSFLQGPLKESFSTSDGRFVMSGLDQGKEYQVTVDAGKAGSTVKKGVSGHPEDDETEEVFYLSGEGQLEGIVYDSKGGKPLSGIRVVHALYGEFPIFDWDNLTDSNLALQAVQSAITGSDGRFSFQESEEQGTILINAKGYEKVLMRPGERTLNADGLLEIALQKGASLEGQYHDRGMPVSGASLLLMSVPEGLSGGLLDEAVINPTGMELTARSQSDAEGLYKFENLTPGIYQLSHQIIVGMAGIFKIGRRFEIQSGEQLQLNLGDDLGSSRLLGTVVDSSGSPVTGQVIVGLSPLFGWDYTDFGTGTESGGRFEIDGLRDGKYRVTLMRVSLGSDSLLDQMSDSVVIQGDTRKQFVFGSGNLVTAQLAFPDDASEETRKKWVTATLTRVDASQEEDETISRFGTCLVQDGRISFHGKFRGEYKITVADLLSTRRVDLPGTFQLDTLTSNQDLGSIPAPE